MPAYSHRCSPKKFTQHQLFACLALKEFFKLDYRGVETFLAENSVLRDVIGLREPPDFTTLHKACRRLLRLPTCNRLLDQTIVAARRTPLLRAKVALAAIDSSGFEAHRASNYFVRRRVSHGKQAGKWQSITYRRFPKLGVVCDCSSHLILAAVPHLGPSPDFDHWIRAMDDARRRVRMTTLLADAGYDAEWIHLAARLVHGTRTIIPPKHGRPTDKPPRGYYRRRMTRNFDRAKYAQRAQVETTFSMLKRRLDSSVNAFGYWSQCRALMLKAITHNIMILKQRAGFRQSQRRLIWLDAFSRSKGTVFARQLTACPLFWPDDYDGSIGICTHPECGCGVTTARIFMSKVNWAREQCPLGKWPAL